MTDTMHIRLQREQLLQPLGYVVGVVERRQTLPILSHVLLRVADKEVTLTGTDLEVEVIAGIESSAASKAGEMTLPARKLFDICRALPEGAMVDIHREGEKVVLKSGKSRFSLLTLPATDFPNVQTTEWECSLRVSQGTLKSLFDQTHFCMAQQDVRYYLHGLLMEFNADTLRVVATDGHRMAISETALERSAGNSRQAIVPRKGVLELTRLLSDSEDKLELHLSSNHLRAVTQAVTFTTKLIDGRYPDYTKVIPTSHNKVVRVDRPTFREALARTAILLTEKYRGVRISLSGGTMVLTAHNPEQEEAQEEIPVEYSGDPLEIGFNASYLTDAVSALKSEKVVFALNDSNSSSTLQAPDASYPKYVIMPMRL